MTEPSAAPTPIPKSRQANPSTGAVIGVVAGKDGSARAIASGSLADAAAAAVVAIMYRAIASGSAATDERVAFSAALRVSGLRPSNAKTGPAATPESHL